MEGSIARAHKGTEGPMPVNKVRRGTAAGMVCFRFARMNASSSVTLLIVFQKIPAATRSTPSPFSAETDPDSECTQMPTHSTVFRLK